MMKTKRKLITSVIAITAVVAGSSAALAGITTNGAFLSSRLQTGGNYAWLADASTTYNCLAYAKGDTSLWDWPWGSANPNSTQVDTYLGYSGFTSVAFSSNQTGTKIISYGLTSSSIGHFAKVADANYVNAKWGTLELLQHLGWNPYSSSSSNGTYLTGTFYGEAQRKYAK
ncbi:hypothetical protein [Paenibacillus sp. SYP-B3998]|uniref:DUF7689 domain-containing protein n=1 Tax=Paenibacillus sp. SYP-B3998 TaxID=2678564 RepID=UPI00196846CC|nr:hypothetical protein [Paenibacillus sp. SYP-B3998]